MYYVKIQQKKKKIQWRIDKVRRVEGGACDMNTYVHDFSSMLRIDRDLLSYNAAFVGDFVVKGNQKRKALVAGGHLSMNKHL